MSSFPGRMKEYPTISIDRFDRENVYARAYFLSHCHKDHMKGLKGPLLKRKLKLSLTVKLYCSFVTKELLLSNPKYAFWEDHIVALELDNPSHISLIDDATGESEGVLVTLLPAGHCPGSVMFLFEGAQGTVLYTGDFRLASGDASRMEFLHSGNRVKDIQSVYVDSTFFDPRFFQIPSREACLRGIRELIQDWLILSPYHVVWLNCKAAYGYEYLFTNLSEEFGCQIHVNSLDMFQKMPEILSHVTTDRATQIHACRHPRDEEFMRMNRLPCGCTSKDGHPLRIISIKPSTIWFGERTRKTNVIVRMGESSFRACFSFHSSYSEIKDFLSYICPVNIYPNVIPLGRTYEDVSELLKPLCREYSGREVVAYKPLGALKRSRDQGATTVSDSDDELFAEFAMAPRKKKPLAGSERATPECSNTPAPPCGLGDFLPELRPVTLSANYVDCSESNDDDDEDDEEEGGSKQANDGKKVIQAPKPELNGEQSCCESAVDRTSNIPQWDAFFKPASLPTDESSEPDDSQPSLAYSSECTTSKSPELSQEDGMDPFHLFSSQSTHISDGDSWSGNYSEMDTILIPPVHPGTTEEKCENMTANGESAGKITVMPDLTVIDSPRGKSDVVENEETRPHSQGSSEFELPAPPGSLTPQPVELKELYWKLAEGENLSLSNRMSVSRVCSGGPRPFFPSPICDIHGDKEETENSKGT